MVPHARNELRRVQRVHRDVRTTHGLSGLRLCEPRCERTYPRLPAVHRAKHPAAGIRRGRWTRYCDEQAIMIAWIDQYLRDILRLRKKEIRPCCTAIHGLP